MKRVISLIVAMIILSISVYAQNVQEITLIDTNSEDVHINPSSSFPTGGLCFGLTNTGQPQRSFLKFDIANLPKDVSKVELKITSGFVTSISTIRTVHFSSVDSDWAEATTTFSNQPAFGTAFLGNADVKANNEIVTLDITKLYQDWITGIIPNFGISFIDSTETGTGPDAKCFVSSDSGTASTPISSRPTLIITESAQTQQLTTAVLQPGAEGIDTGIAGVTSQEGGFSSGNTGNLYFMDVGEHPKVDTLYRGLIKFDLSSIPSNAVVQSAKLEMFAAPSDPLSFSPRPATVYEVLKPWTEMGATDFFYDGITKWELRLASGVGDVGSAAATAAITQNAFAEFNLDTKAVQNWIDFPEFNNGLIIKDDAESNIVFHFKTSDEADATKRPKLTITYTLGPGISANDQDGDGVEDVFDLCPDTDPLCFVDMNGCSTDADSDSVCAGSCNADGSQCGDSFDNDACSVFNNLDWCGLPGCNFDTDNDGFFTDINGNGCDLLPDDSCSGFISGDACGSDSCNVDTDNNGIADLCEDPCTLLSAKWSTTSAAQGSLVTLTATGSPSCENKQVRFNIFEDDLVFDEDYSPDPNSGIMKNGKATTTWNAEWIPDGFAGDPEFYFYAIADGLQIRSSLLSVTRGTSLCGNGVTDSGENCVTCPQDSGCKTGDICCSSDPTVTCKTQCQVKVDNNDNICDTGESCNVNACNSKTDGCISGNMCVSGTCGCKTEKDGVCSLDSACKKKDPDCDKDGDSFVDEDDNCPNVNNQDQTDSDNDAVKPLCNYGVLPFVTDLGYLCGGDLCDYDDDNDGICDAGESNEFCKGSDLCPGTLEAQDVDENGCSASETKCFAQWDCTNLDWSECNEETGLRTRDIGKCDSKEDALNGLCKCSVNAVSDDCWQSTYRPINKKSCVKEEEFPVFTWFNLLITTLLLGFYYMIRKK